MQTVEAPKDYEYGDLRAMRLTVDFKDGKPKWTCQVQVKGKGVIDGWVGSGGWSSPMEALEYELDIAKKRAARLAIDSEEG